MNPRGPVVIEEHDPGWITSAAIEATRLSPLGPVEHIGSTAIPGMPAKPILDLMLGVKQAEQLDAIVGPVEALGYLHYQSWDAIQANRRYFWQGPDAQHTHHLHVVVLHSHFWRVHLIFRDRLRADPALATAYEQLKRDLARRFPDDRDAYTDGKAEFIERVCSD